LSRVLEADFSPAAESAYSSNPSVKDTMDKRIRGRDSYQSGRKRPVRKGVSSSPPGKRRLLITEKTHDDILKMIQNWPLDCDLSWGDLMELIGRTYHGKWTRAAVAKYPDLQDAFSHRSGEIRKFKRDQAKAGGRRVAKTRDDELAYLKDQIGLLNRENGDLKRRIAETDARLARWRHNALMHRMTVRQLDTPLQENDRGRSDR
jgi:hypothetical protein